MFSKIEACSLKSMVNSLLCGVELSKSMRFPKILIPSQKGQMATNRITPQLNKCASVHLKSILEEESQDKSNLCLGQRVQST